MGLSCARRLGDTGEPGDRQPDGGLPGLGADRPVAGVPDGLREAGRRRCPSPRPSSPPTASPARGPTPSSARSGRRPNELGGLRRRLIRRRPRPPSARQQMVARSSAASRVSRSRWSRRASRRSGCSRCAHRGRRSRASARGCWSPPSDLRLRGTPSRTSGSSTREFRSGCGRHRGADAPRLSLGQATRVVAAAQAVHARRPRRAARRAGSSVRSTGRPTVRPGS